MKSIKISLLEKMSLKHCFRKEKRNNLFSVKDIYEEMETNDISIGLNNERDINNSEQEKNTIEAKNFVEIYKSKKGNENFVTAFDDEPYKAVSEDSEKMTLSESDESVDEDSEKMTLSEFDESVDEDNEKETLNETSQSVDEDSREVPLNKPYEANEANEANNENAEKVSKYNPSDFSLENEEEKRTFFREKTSIGGLENKKKKYIGTIIVSPFLSQELDKFSFQRNKLLNNKLFLLDYHTENLLQRYRFVCFNNAIEIIEDKVRKNDQQILILKQEYEDKMQQIKITYDLYTKHQTPHHAQYCIEQAQHLCNEYREMIKDYFSQIIELLSEEIKLIKKMNNVIDSCKEKRLFVIRYYYNAVVKEKRHLFLSGALDDGMYMYSDKVIDVFYGGRLNQDHTMKCSEVENRLKWFKKQTNILLSVKFW